MKQDPAKKRRKEIAGLLQKDGAVRSSVLAAKYNVTRETIRQDLASLEEDGIAQKTYGGAVLNGYGIEKETAFRNVHGDRKKVIARAASRRIGNNHSIYLGSGTTCLALVPYLNRMPPLDIFTSSLEAACRLDGKKHNVFLLPGRKREKSLSVLGDWAETFVRNSHFDLCFLGTSGLATFQGPTSHSYAELGLKKSVIERSDMVCILADSSKFQENGLHAYADWDVVDLLITDPAILDQALQSLPEDLNLVIAGVEENA